MAVTFTSLRDLAETRFDDIIDVRSPSEFAADHLPGAVNVPVLDDEERARVGTIYKQVSPFDARKLGAALISRNVAGHLEGPLANKPGGWRPLLYCWRGGQRSGSMATILSQIGWRAEIIHGGYKSWRGLVVQALEADPQARLILLDGNTGSAKTELLHLLAVRGIQIIDLEGLANHRGSLFGSRGPQPSQRMFEGRLAQVLANLDLTRPVVIEAESSAIGRCRIPPRLWKAMCDAARIEVQAPADERAHYLARTYVELTSAPDRLALTIDQLRPFHSAEHIAEWHIMAARSDYVSLAKALILAHYDPRYAKHRARSGNSRQIVFTDSLDASMLISVADRLAAEVLRV